MQESLGMHETPPVFMYAMPSCPTMRVHYFIVKLCSLAYDAPSGAVLPSCPCRDMSGCIGHECSVGVSCDACCGDFTSVIETK